MSDESTSPSLARLRADPLFSHIATVDLARLLGAMEEVVFTPGQTVYRQGDAASALYLFASGEAMLTCPGETPVEVLHLRCGEEAAGGLKHYLCSAVAQTALQGWRISKSALSDIAKTQAGFTADALLSLAPYLGRSTVAQQTQATGIKAAAVSTSQLWGWFSVLTLPALVFAIAQSYGLSDQAAIFSAILTAAVLMWVFALMDEFIPPLIAVVATLFIGLAPANVALSGFASPSLMTLLGVFALSATISASGLSYRVMLWLLMKLPDRPVWQQSALLASGYVLSTITPSGNSRLSLLLPLYRDMLDGLRLPHRGVMATGLMAATFSGAMLFSPMLSTSKASNITAISMMPAQYQEQFLGLFWLVAAGAAALGQTVLHLLAMRWIFKGNNPVALPKDRIAIQLQLLGAWTHPEKIALAGFVFFLAGASTVSWHHIQPSLIAGCVLLGLLLSGVFGKKEFRQQLDWPMVFFLLGMDSITRTMHYLGLDTQLAQAVGASYGFINGQIALFILAALVTTVVVRLALPTVAGMLVAVIILMPVAQAHGIHPWICIFLTALFSDIWFAAYQNGVYSQFCSRGAAAEYDASLFMRYNHFMNLSRVAVAFISIPYWQWLGLL